MKKALLFGIGILLTGSVFAVPTPINGDPIDTKDSGGLVTAEEFNLMTKVTNLFLGTQYTDDIIIFAKNIAAPILSAGNITALSDVVSPELNATTKVTTPELCLDGDCKTEWEPGADNLGNHTATTTLTTKAIVPDANATYSLGSNTKTFQKTYSKEFCIGEDCITTWPTSTEGTTITAKTCPSGQQLQAVSSTGTFTCGTDLEGSSDGGGIDDYSCGTGEVVKGIRDGVFSCVTDETGTTSGDGITNQTCATGEFVKGIADGTFTCETDQTGTSSGDGVADQACEAGEVVKGIADGTFTCVADQNDGSGDSPIGDLQEQRFCWSPDGSTIECNQLSGGDEAEECLDNDYHKCTSNKLYWFDSCGNPMMDGFAPVMKQDCALLGGCTTGDINQPCNNNDDPCEPQYKAKCVSGDIYWYNSCGVLGVKKEECGSASCSTSNHTCNKDISPLPSAPTDLTFQYPTGGYCLSENPTGITTLACSMAKLTWAAPTIGDPIEKYVITFTIDDAVLLGPPIEQLFDVNNDLTNPCGDNMSSIGSNIAQSQTRNFLSQIFPTAFAENTCPVNPPYDPSTAGWATAGTRPSTTAISVADLIEKMQTGKIKTDSVFLSEIETGAGRNSGGGTTITRVVPGTDTQYIMRGGDIPEGRWKVSVQAVNAIGTGPASASTDAVGIVIPGPSPLGIAIQAKTMNYSNEEDSPL